MGQSSILAVSWYTPVSQPVVIGADLNRERFVRMDTSTLTTHIQRFLDVPETDLLIQEQIEDHSRRQKKAAALLQTDRLQDVTPDKLHDLLEDTDA